VIGDHIPPTKMVEDIKAQRKAVEASLRNLPDMIKKMRYVRRLVKIDHGAAMGGDCFFSFSHI